MDLLKKKNHECAADGVRQAAPGMRSTRSTVPAVKALHIEWGGKEGPKRDACARGNVALTVNLKGVGSCY